MRMFLHDHSLSFSVGMDAFADCIVSDELNRIYREAESL